MDKLKQIGIDHIYCINVEQKKERWGRMKVRFHENKLEVERFNALIPETKKFNEFWSKTQHPKKIEAACTFSHVSIWQDALEKNYQTILVFEDDVLFLKNGVDKLVEHVSTIEEEDKVCDLFMLDSCSLKMSRESKVFQIKDHYLSGAYMIRRSAFTKGVDMFSSNQKLGKHIGIEQLLMKIQVDGHSWTSTPRICVQEYIDSDIQEPGHFLYIQKWYNDNYMKWFSDQYF